MAKQNREAIERAAKQASEKFQQDQSTKAKKEAKSKKAEVKPLTFKTLVRFPKIAN